MRSALVNKETNIVENIIMADPQVDATPEGYLMIDVENFRCDIGWVFDPIMIDFVNPNPPVEESVPPVEETPTGG